MIGLWASKGRRLPLFGSVVLKCLEDAVPMTLAELWGFCPLMVSIKVLREAKSTLERMERQSVEVHHPWQPKSRPR